MLIVHGIIILTSLCFILLHKLPVKAGLLLIAMAFLGGCQLVMQQPEQAVIKRPDYGEEAAEYTLYFQEAGNHEEMDIHIDVPARTYTVAQLDKMAEEVFALLSQMILDSNKSAETVSAPLSLVETVSGYPFQITWISENQSVISNEGAVYNEALDENIVCRLTAELRWEDYEAMQDFYVNVQPEGLTEQEQKIRQLTEDIHTLLKKEENADTVTLPIEISGGRLYGSIPNPMVTLLWPFLAVIWLLLQRVREQEAIKEQEKRRMDNLEYMYPDFVNQMVLYLSAGMTIRTAMAQIMEGLEQEKGSAQQTLYQELAGMFHGLKGGMSEKEAYQSFGKRCGHGGYRKLMSLMIQTILVGGKGLLARLEELEAEAFTKRKEYAKTKGEEASAKLFIPMVILLAIVMLLLVIPGFYGMGR